MSKNLIEKGEVSVEAVEFWLDCLHEALLKIRTKGVPEKLIEIQVFMITEAERVASFVRKMEGV